MPAEMNNALGSFSGIRETFGIILWSFDLKNYRYFFISCFRFILFFLRNGVLKIV